MLAGDTNNIIRGEPRSGSAMMIIGKNKLESLGNEVRTRRAQQINKWTRYDSHTLRNIREIDRSIS